MPDYQEIYRTQAEEYEALVSREDYQGNLLRALNHVCPLDGLDVIELGAGTGRLTRLIAPQARTIRAFDISPHMLGVAIAKLGETSLRNWQVAVADNRALPVADRVADLSIVVPAKITPRIQEAHIMIIHYLCEVIDEAFFQST